MRAKQHAKVLVGPLDQLGSERSRNELRVACQGVDLLGDGRAVLRVEIRINLVKQVEGRGITLLDRKDEGEGDERLLTTGQLRHAHGGR